MAKKKDNHLFDVLNSINNKKEIKYDKSKANGYILMLWLSHSKELIDIVSKLNYNLFKIPDELIYKYFYKSVPKKNRFIKWVKKEDSDKINKKELEELTVKYKISETEAKKSLRGRI